MKFYVSWIQSYSYAAAVCHAIIECDSKQDARETWIKKSRACPAYDKVPEELFKVSDLLLHLSDAEILEFYDGPHGVCTHIQEGKCRYDCSKGNLPYGCYTETRQQWFRKYGDLNESVKLENKRMDEMLVPIDDLAHLSESRWLRIFIIGAILVTFIVIGIT